ncbi:protoporphyrinogen oxidase HemJ [Alteromonas sp. a30]|uniref:protoporphyrinogen oxidase HemJ n=1 Tax=Alteromonas sp. a30 TaxID=2730917 RepID=UPI002280A3FE|nr:protoporphyrinogen oxidase HemJ [Alteromonas sp. a30]MCY7294618.1 protoporphyrinogen oxidase HemJ [Alteromonas sp. a30]
MAILWFKAFHIFFVIAWFAGIFYLPRLFVYHADATENSVKETFKIMQRRLWWFVLPFAVLTAITGIGMLHLYGSAWVAASGWLHAKLTLVVLIYIYYGYLFKVMKQFERDENQRSAKFYRFLNEAPVLVLLAIVILVIVKPF